MTFYPRLKHEYVNISPFNNFTEVGSTNALDIWPFDNFTETLEAGTPSTFDLSSILKKLEARTPSYRGTGIVSGEKNHRLWCNHHLEGYKNWKCLMLPKHRLCHLNHTHIQVYLIMSNPKDKLENDIYVLKSAARPWLAIQIGDIVDPHTKARNGWVNITWSPNLASDCLCIS